MPNATTQRPNWLRRFLTPPVFPDEDKTRTARLLHSITLLLWPIYLMAVAITLIQSENKIGSMLLNTLLISLLVLTTYLHRSGRVHRASVVFVSLRWVIVMIAVIAFGELTSPMLSGLLLMTLIAGLLLGGRGAIATALVTLAALTAMLIGRIEIGKLLSRLQKSQQQLQEQYLPPF